MLLPRVFLFFFWGCHPFFPSAFILPLNLWVVFIIFLSRQTVNIFPIFLNRPPFVSFSSSGIFFVSLKLVSVFSSSRSSPVFYYYFLFLLFFTLLFFSSFFLTPLFSSVYYFLLSLFTISFSSVLIFFFFFFFCSSGVFPFSLPFTLFFLSFFYVGFPPIFFSFFFFFFAFSLCIYMTQSSNSPHHEAIAKLRHIRNCCIFAVRNRISIKPW